MSIVFIMPMLLWRLNYRNIVLDEGAARKEDVGILKRDGEISYRPWLGFIDRDVAISIPGAIPVKIEVAAYSQSAGAPADWVYLGSAGKMIQGCLVAEGVFAVLDKGMPRVVRRTGQTGIDGRDTESDFRS